MSDSTKLKDFFKTDKELTDLLKAAVINADTTKTNDFIGQLTSKFEAYGLGMFFSAKQLKFLRSLADARKEDILK